MFFSIIIPVYNAEKYIKDCIDSITVQSFTDYEIILVDDGSTDNSRITCDYYASKNESIKVIHKENGGAASARNAGIKNALGNYILFIDCDDYIEKDSLVSIFDTINLYSNPDLVCLEMNHVFESQNKIVSVGDGITDEINSLSGDDLYIYLSKLPKYPASPCTKALKRSFILDNDLFFVNNLLCEDIDWSLNVFTNVNRIAYCNHPYYYYRKRKDSSSKTYSEKQAFDLLSIVQKWNKIADIQSVAKKSLIYSFMEFSIRMVFVTSIGVSKTNLKKFADDLKNESYILGTRSDDSSKMISITYKLFGFRITRSLLKLYLDIRDR